MSEIRELRMEAEGVVGGMDSPRKAKEEKNTVEEYLQELRALLAAQTQTIITRKSSDSGTTSAYTTN